MVCLLLLLLITTNGKSNAFQLRMLWNLYGKMLVVDWLAVD